MAMRSPGRANLAKKALVRASTVRLGPRGKSARSTHALIQRAGARLLLSGTNRSLTFCVIAAYTGLSLARRVRAQNVTSEIANMTPAMALGLPSHVLMASFHSGSPAKSARLSNW